jgi:hypothetical protein
MIIFVLEDICTENNNFLGRKETENFEDKITKIDLILGY